MVNPDSLSRIDSFLSSAVSELFGLYGLELRETVYEEREIEDPFAATLGFTSVPFRGALVLIASRAVIERSLPANIRTSAIDTSIIADWTGELANQVLGRLKNHLFAAGVNIELSTPAVFAGKGLRHFTRQSNLVRSLLFRGDGPLFVELQADHEAGLEIGEEAEGETGTPEGEALFF